MDEQSVKCIDVISETGFSNWLNVALVKKYNYILNKQQFWDKICLKYNWPDV